MGKDTIMTAETPELDILIKGRSRIRLYPTRTDVTGIDTPEDLVNVLRAVMAMARVFEHLEPKILGGDDDTP